MRGAPPSWPSRLSTASRTYEPWLKQGMTALTSSFAIRLDILSHLDMRLTVRHHFDFGADRAVVGEDLVRAEAWDALRTQTSGAFALAPTREEWERTADEHPELEARARRIEELLDARGVGRLASYGAGGATLECWLKRLAPERELAVADYADATVGRLAGIFTEAECVRHDLLEDPPLRADLHLFHRIDTEFTNGQWRRIFERFARLPVLLVAAGQVDVRGAIAEWRKGRRPGASRAGWVRTRPALEALWGRTHTARAVDVGDLPAWELSPN